MSALFCLSLAACDLQGFNLGGNLDDAGAGSGDGGDIDGDGGGGGADAGPDANNCVPSPEICDGFDNDCNGNVDETFDLQNDPANCGECGADCDKFGTIGSCSAGECSFVCRTGFVDLDGDIDANGCEYQCTPTNTMGTDSCDLTDNDCDGKVDEDIDLDTDTTNCGSCNNLCLVLNATPVCDAFPDTDVVCTGDGECAPVGGRATECRIPQGLTEGVCVFSQACIQGTCDAGFLDCDDTVNNDCTFQPNVPGCEYECPVYPPDPMETCDGEDDDCDGKIDEGFGIGTNCDNEADGTCFATGIIVCDGAGGTECNAPTIPEQDEICGDGLDTNCNGITDANEPAENLTGIDTDPNNCGGCGIVCNDEFDNAITTCQSQTCSILACENGWVDDPDLGGNDCLYQCTTTGAEICDGVDNDCDKLTDADDVDDFVDLNDLGANFCDKIGPCGTAAGGGAIKPVCGTPGSGDLSGLPATCGDGIAWYCDYDASDDGTLDKIQVDANCEPVNAEEDTGAGYALCDDFDNDCDGGTDENWPELGNDCADNGIGICQGTGTFQCLTDGSNTECNITDPGETALGYEECNGLDDNCDGTADENAVDEMVMVTFTADPACTTEGAGCADTSGELTGTCQADLSCAYWVDTYEAVRTENQEDEEQDPIACSVQGGTPWSLVTQTEAANACAANGKRLCTQDEWELACAGALDQTGTAYPYGDTYDPYACNGFDWNPDCNPSPAMVYEQAEVTGFSYAEGSMGSCSTSMMCISDSSGAVDMSGNVREWTSSFVTTANGDAYKVRGGSYNEPEQGLTCQNDFITLLPDNAFDNLGFRCCRSTAPPTAP